MWLYFFVRVRNLNMGKLIFLCVGGSCGVVLVKDRRRIDVEVKVLFFLGCFFWGCFRGFGVFRFE